MQEDVLEVGLADLDAGHGRARTPHRAEQRWQRRWEELGTFHAPNPAGSLAGDGEPAADKLFVQDMFPYPSGAGLHVGHPLGYIATDVIGRYQRMKGRNVLHALAYDAAEALFG